MKKLIFALVLLVSFSSYAQDIYPLGSGIYMFEWKKGTAGWPATTKNKTKARQMVADYAKSKKANFEIISINAPYSRTTRPIIQIRFKLVSSPKNSVNSSGNRKTLSGHLAEKNNKPKITSSSSSTSKSQVKFYSTDYGIFDLKDEDMKYYLKNYITAFLYDIGTPDIYMLLHYAAETDVLAIRDYFNNTMHSKLNKKDLHYIKSFESGHKTFCKMDFPNDSNCPLEVYNLEVNVDYKTLDGEMLAYAVGNIFENREIRIVVDPGKMAKASPSKRAYIMYHELFHTLGIQHGECGLMMFPYVEKEYTWDDFTHGKIQAHECFVRMRNYLQRYSN